MFRFFVNLQETNRPWILVALEDSYILTENLRYYVAPMNQSKPLYLGHAMKYWSSIYNWASASFAFNWLTLEKLLNHFDTLKSCDEAGKYWKNGDWYLGKYLAQLDIHPEDTRDHAGKKTTLMANKQVFMRIFNSDGKMNNHK